jgi:hypothetical protein
MANYENFAPSGAHQAKGKKCSFCGHEHPTGEWDGIGLTVVCCEGCAVKVLPVFMADCVSLPILPLVNEYHAAIKRLKQIEGNYWKGIAARLSMRR